MNWNTSSRDDSLNVIVVEDVMTNNLSKSNEWANGNLRDKVSIGVVSHLVLNNGSNDATSFLNWIFVYDFQAEPETMEPHIKISTFYLLRLFHPLLVVHNCEHFFHVSNPGC
ncbi:hypothetical protein LINPERHAP1_LOCUS35062, partial [Linum perenne]